jgi:hypothetical protein
MSEISLDSSELLAVLALTDTETLAGLEEHHLPLPAENDRQAVIEEGLDKLLNNGLLSAHGNHYHADESLISMIEVMVQPLAVVRTIRESADGEEQRSWHFATASAFVRMSAVADKEFRLELIPDEQTVKDQISELLPLELVSENLTYRATVNQEDAQEIRSLALDWDQVPALELMEADGLNVAQSKQLFEEIAEPVWRGRIDFIDCREGASVSRRRVLALQGQETSWLAWQTRPDESALHLQTASAGLLEKTVSDYWSEVVA